MLWARVNWWIVGALGEELQRGEIFEFDEWKEPLGVGDFDGDGQVDFLTEFTSDIIEGSKGVVLQRKGAGDRLEAEVLYDDRLLRRSPVSVRDLNADGVDDWVFIGGDRVSGFGVFVEWGGRVNPTQEGERHRLGDSYPNPFNPAVVIPLDLAKDAAGVSLTVYDVLGRRVRQVWDGALRAGTHRFTWDGRDAAGKVVAAGVYIYQVEIDGQVEAKKTTKLP